MFFMELNNSSLPYSKKDKTFDLCMKKESAEKIEKLLPKIVKVSKRERENWAVKALPSDWKPVYLPSIAVQNVTKKRETQHSKCLKEMENEMADINAKVESKIRIKSEWIKQEYVRIQTQSEIKITGILKCDTKFAELTWNEFKETSKDIQELHLNYLDKIKEFYGYLLRLERTRCYHFKNILRRAFEDLHKVSFKLPKELQEIFEHRILHINQITLSNLRCYHDICSTLQLQGENSARRWLQAFTSLKDKWKAVQMEQAAQKIMVIRNAFDSELLQKEIVKSFSIQFDLKQKESAYSSSSSSSLHQSMLIPLQPDELNEWCNTVEAEIKKLGHVTKTLVSLYRGAIIQVFNGYMEEFQNISQKMIDTVAVDYSELEEFNKKVAIPIIDEIDTQLSSNISGIKLFWEDISSKLEKQTKISVSFLRDAALIWDAHFERLAVLKATVLKELDQATEINDKQSEKIESSIFIAIDKLRQESTKNALDKSWTSLSNLLDELLEEYLADCHKEMKIINKFPELSNDETELLTKELRQFLNAYPKKVGEIRRASRCTFTEEPDYILPAQMKMCEYEVEALENWILGLWEAIDKYLLSCHEELSRKSKELRDTHLKRILKRLEVKVAFHKARYERIRINIYNTRLAELEAHIKRFERHKNEIQVQMQEMCNASVTLEGKLQRMLEKDYEELDALVLRKVENSKNSELITAISYEVKLVSNKLLSQAEDIKNECNAIIQTKQSEITESNHEFRKSIKLFSEDGNFSQDEAKRYFHELKKLEAALSKKVQTLQKENDMKLQKVKNGAQQKLLSIQNMLKFLKDELQFREEVMKEIRNVQSVIKIGIYDKKYTLKRFSAEIRRLTHPVFSDIENFSRLKTNFKDLAERILGFQMYLLKKEVEKDVDVISISGRRSLAKNVSIMSKQSKISASSSRASTARSKSSAATSSSGTDYTAFLFSIRPPDTCTFMMEFNTAIYDSMDIIQRLAKRFYRKDRIVRNTDLLQPTLHQFMGEILRKYRRYCNRLEMAWMDVINETLKLLKQLLHFIWKQYEVMLQSFLATKIKKASEEQNKRLSAADGLKERYESANRDLHANLKAHYGHSDNKPFLKFLLKEAEGLRHKLKLQDTYDWLQEYEHIQKKERENFLIDLNSLEADLNVLKDIGFSLVNAKLIEQFEQNLQSRTKDSAQLVKKEGISATWTTISEVSMRYENLKSQSKISSESNKTTLTLTKNTLTSSSSTLIQNVPKNSIMDIRSEIIYEKTLSREDVIKEFDEELKKRVSQADEFQTNLDYVLQKWEKIWRASKDKLTNLYVVKYDNQ